MTEAYRRNYDRIFGGAGRGDRTIITLSSPFNVMIDCPTCGHVPTEVQIKRYDDARTNEYLHSCPACKLSWTEE